ncbi:MAG: hypothetical protein L0Y67_05265 [Gammaproteobacteria bacterium]|nr:hypothetical protein [Gammaproteobacteria bacterium]
MPVAASQILDFLERQEAFTLERRVITSPMFAVLRQSLRQIVLRLRDSDEDEAIEITGRLRSLLSEWLTVPVTFDASLVDTVRHSFGDAGAIQSRWGSDILRLYEAAIQAADNLTSTENPVREDLRQVIRNLRLQDRNFKLYCHRRARLFFESLFVSPLDLPLQESTFLHSVRDYRESEPFDVLIKVGPLRSRGWGSAPDALITAPRFDTLILIVWSGCSDEPGFGYDPSSPVTASLDLAQSASGRVAQGSLRWTEHVMRTGKVPTSPQEYVAEEDDLQIFKEANRPNQYRHAKLVLIDAEHGILFPPHSLVLSFDPSEGAPEPIARRIPGETLFEGMYVLKPLLDDIDLGKVRAEHGYYSKIWKAKLAQELSVDDSSLIQRLRAAGLDLVHLAAAIRKWCRPPGTVIHAPQQIRHFEILMRALGLEGNAVGGPNRASSRWWESAWVEIRRSRGDAIQAGVIGNEIVEEQLLITLTTHLRAIRKKASTKNESFEFTLPDSGGIQGHLLFFPVCGIEEGFNAPETQLRIVHELDVIDQWRD